jgi:hypothetical protein
MTAGQSSRDVFIHASPGDSSDINGPSDEAVGRWPAVLIIDVLFAGLLERKENENRALRG